MRPSLNFRDGMSAQIAIAAIRTEQSWEDTVLDVAVEALDYAKTAAPWADRTGAAREGLDVDVDKVSGEIVLTMFHTVEYGQWLETIQAGQLAIIMPTLELYGPEIKRRIE